MLKLNRQLHMRDFDHIVEGRHIKSEEVSYSDSSRATVFEANSFRDVLLPQKVMRASLIVIIVAIVLETFIFNFRHWESLTFGTSSSPTMSVGASLEKNVDGTYHINGSDDAYFELTGMDSSIRNVYLDLVGETETRQGTDARALQIQLCVTDDANSTYMELDPTEIVPSVEESKYIRLHLIGKTPRIRVNLVDAVGRNVNIDSVEVNVQRPFLFHWWRFVSFLIVGALFAAFRPGSSIYRIPLDWHRVGQKAVIVVLVTMNVLLLMVIGLIFRNDRWNDSTPQFHQYQLMAESLTRGHMYIDQYEPPAELQDMRNPYDSAERRQVLLEAEESSITDFAYHDGHYYSYFGAVPLFLFFLPFYVLTGNWLPTSNLVILCVALFVPMAFWLLYLMVQRYFQHVSLGMYLLLSLALVAGSEIAYCVQYPIVYSVPFATGILFATGGLCCWYMSVGKDERIHCGWLVAGAVALALVMGCRPQLVITVFLAFPLFAKQIRERQFFSIAGLRNTASVIVPFLAVGGALMVYNWMRFGSVLDFGATYNLTGFDMTHRGFIPDRLWLGFYEYFLQPLRVEARFPYVTAVAPHMGLQADYQGQIINEPLLAGFFALNPLGLFLMGTQKVSTRLRKHRVLSLVVLLITCSIILVVLDVQMVGMTLRYLMDFSGFLMLAACLVIFALVDGVSLSSSEKFILSCIVMLAMLGIFVNYFSLCAAGRYNSLQSCSPFVYYNIKYVLFSIFSIR